MLHKFLHVLAVACLATAIVLIWGFSGSQREPKAGGLPSDAKSVTSDDSVKAVAEADSTGVQDSVKVVKEKPVRYIQRRPERYSSVEIDGIQYTAGVIGLETDADTALLAPYRFRFLRFKSRTPSGVYYHARWPVDLEPDSLPPQVIYVDYSKLDEPELNVSAHSIEADTSKKPVKEKSRRRFRPPPEDFPFRKHRDGIEYGSASFKLENDGDTTLLRKFGCKDFRFFTRDSTGVYYDAWFPKNLPLDSLPQQIKRILYDEQYKKFKPGLNVSADSIKTTAPKSNSPEETP